MVFSKLRLSPGFAFALLMACSWASQTLPVSSQEQQPPDASQVPAAPDQAAPTDQAAPAAPADTLPPSDGSAPPPAAAEPAAPAPDGAAAAPPNAEPAPDSGAAATAPSDTSAPPADSGAAQVPPAQPDQPATAAEPAQPAAPEGAPAGGTITASEVAIGTAVFGADGTKIGEVNGVKSDDSGKIQEILVTDGVPAGMNAKVFEISADKIVSVSDGVKLSLSAEDTKKLPIIDNSSG